MHWWGLFSFCMTNALEAMGLGRWTASAVKTVLKRLDAEAVGDPGGRGGVEALTSSLVVSITTSVDTWDRMCILASRPRNWRATP